MLKQGSVGQLRKGQVSRKDGYIVVAMCFYPRNLSKDLRDEYVGAIAPDKILFKDWLAFEREFGHDVAFEKSDYENRFVLDMLGFAYLKRLSFESRDQDIFLICQCELGERCHREMMLLAANKVFGAKIDKVFHAYPRFLARLPQLLSEAKFNPELDVRI